MYISLFSLSETRTTPLGPNFIINLFFLSIYDLLIVGLHQIDAWLHSYSSHLLPLSFVLFT